MLRLPGRKHHGPHPDLEAEAAGWGVGVRMVDGAACDCIGDRLRGRETNVQVLCGLRNDDTLNPSAVVVFVSV